MSPFPGAPEQKARPVLAAGREPEDSANLPDPNILAQEIADDLRSALGQIEDILGDPERPLPPSGGTS